VVALLLDRFGPVGGPPRPRVDQSGILLIRNFAASWAKAKPPTRAAMIQSLYQEIVVRERSS
jgi:hypothetical protein